MKITKIFFIALIVYLCYLNTVEAQLAAGKPKFLGNVLFSGYNGDFTNFWNQYTFMRQGKWATLQNTQANWTTYNYTLLNTQLNLTSRTFLTPGTLPRKHSAFIDKRGDPTWIEALDSAGRIAAIKTWMSYYCQNFPFVKVLDVVNEPLHQRPVYVEDLGGNGTTGWDWVITAFEIARDSCKTISPTAKLLINEYITDAP